MVRFSILFTLALAANSLALHAQTTAEIEKGEAILDRFVSVTGGAAAYARVQSLVSSGTIVYQRPGRADFSFTFSNYTDRSDQRYALMESRAGEKIESGVSTGRAWAVSPASGLRMYEAGERAFAVRNAVFLGWSRWRELYRAAAFVTADGDLDIVGLTPRQKDDPAVLNWYDRNSGLHVRSRWTYQGPNGPIVRAVDVGDYRKAGEILVPYRLSVDEGSTVVVTLTQEVLINETIPPLVFALPSPDGEPKAKDREFQFMRGRKDFPPMARFSLDYRDVFISMQQERNCCTKEPNQIAPRVAGIDRVIAQFKAVDTTGVPPELVKSWEHLRDKHIAEKEAERNQLTFLAKVQAEYPGFRLDLSRDPRASLPPSLAREWTALVEALNRAQSESVASVTSMDAVFEKHSGK